LGVWTLGRAGAGRRRQRGTGKRRAACAKARPPAGAARCVARAPHPSSSLSLGRHLRTWKSSRLVASDTLPPPQNSCGAKNEGGGAMRMGACVCARCVRACE
jgi:hypothetical protein